MHVMLESMINNTTRMSTKNNYTTIWRAFNKFIIRLDVIPESWEQRAALYYAHLVHNGVQSVTIRSYISAIKSTLKLIKYKWNDDTVLLDAVIKSCKIDNDRVHVRFPIKEKLLELILMEISRIQSQQPYLELLYQTIICLGYYGMFQVGELVTTRYTEMQHTMKAKDVHMGVNKKKILVVLYTSKTHGLESRPQKIKITSNMGKNSKTTRFFCPFNLTRQYLDCRGPYKSDEELLLIFRDGTPVTDKDVRSTLKSVIANMGLNPKLYDCHTLRIGRSPQMFKIGYLIEQIKRAGCWKSNAVYKYLRD